ncbi:hypothetical protein [Ottowia testudinis]|uniref:Uncharacterized protein n=1 Tax=Ottowia testudinis TaxID=2816950 RepID=A0A975H415_9BURK|nr:hypothetical protein [Ottowia testudinis]QTD46384.1 hypothetical protein J1M35_05705 [Ottowia testudinis]
MIEYNSICINCGHEKIGWNSLCSFCKFEPKTRRELCESLVLSLDFSVESNEYGNENISKSWGELLSIGNEIKRGDRFVNFLARDIYLAEKQIDRFAKISFADFVFGVIVLTAPVLLVLVLLVFLK